MTFTPGAVLTAAQMNVHIRDNLMASEAALVQQSHDYIVAGGYNQLLRRQVQHSYVGNTETTKSTDWVDLSQASTTTPTVAASTGPSVTLETGTTAWVILSAHCQGSLSLGRVLMGYAINTPTTTTSSDGEAAVPDTEDSEDIGTDQGSTSESDSAREPSEAHALVLDGLNAGGSFHRSYVDFITDLTPGSNTFTCKYKVGSESNTGSFTYRSIIVIPM
jgi:hypothetical protein